MAGAGQDDQPGVSGIRSCQTRTTLGGDGVSCSPTSTSVGTVIVPRSGRESGRSFIASRPPMKPAGGLAT